MGNAGGSKTWFEEHFGFEELPFEETRANFEFSDGVLVSRVNSAKYHVGSFEILSLKELRAQLEVTCTSDAGCESCPTDKLPVPESLQCGLTFQNIVAGIRDLHLDVVNSGAVFQAASQFNCLEMPNPSVRPEDGLSDYWKDGTQGPACALACPAGTVFRNYLINEVGQAGEHQIDCLARVGELVNNPHHKFWTMLNGYCMPGGPGKIGQLSLNIAADPSLAEAVRESLCVGIHWSTEVSGATHNVCQVFCSALPVAYAKTTHSKDWQAFACTVLEGTYEATLQVAAILSVQRRSRVVVYLTKVGGGVFGNRATWITSAIERALARHATMPLDVKLVQYSKLPDAEDPIIQLERMYQPSEAKAPPKAKELAKAKAKSIPKAKAAAKVKATSGAAKVKPRSPRSRPAAKAKSLAAPEDVPVLAVPEVPEDAPALARTFSISTAENIIRVFAAYDTNGDGVIDESEMTHVLRTLDPTLSEVDAKRMFVAADADADDEVHYIEFAAWVTGENVATMGGLTALVSAIPDT